MAFFSTDMLVPFVAQEAPPVAQPGFLLRAMATLWNFFYVGGWFMLPIIICSFIAFIAVILKILELRRANVISAELERTLETLTSSSLPEATERIRNDESTLGEICRQAVLVDHDSREDAERSTESLAREKIFRLERGIPALEMVFTVAPLLGLIGTVSGLVTIFGTFGTKATGPQQAQFIAKGISEALNCTIAGLAVAVPSYMFQSFFARKLETLALRMGTLTTNLMNVAYRLLPERPLDAPSEPLPATPAKSKFQIHPETLPTNG